MHATLAGAVVALAVPVRQENGHVPIDERLHAACSPYVTFLVLPAFALANAGVTLGGSIMLEAATSTLFWGIVIGLVAGKFIGVFGTAVAVLTIAPGQSGSGLTLDRIAGGAALCGIGFTVALLIANIVIDDPGAQNEARIGVIAASVIAATLGSVLFRMGDRLGQRATSSVAEAGFEPATSRL